MPATLIEWRWLHKPPCKLLIDLKPPAAWAHDFVSLFQADEVLR
jgi:hypothetical protein